MVDTKNGNMQQIISVLLTLMTLSCQLNSQHINGQKKELYPIVENGLWGYIDKSGKVIIKPRFRSAGEFAEGFAPVRLNGTYGYIDNSGGFVIQPKYDVAYSFDNGQAKVYIDGKPFFIDYKGKIFFEHRYSEIYGFGENDFSIVETETKKFGLIDKKGQLLVDTTFKQIRDFSNGLSVVIGQHHERYPDDDAEPILEIGVINSNGDYIVPFGKYEDISDFKNGFAKVELIVEYQRGYYDHRGVIDTAGNLRFVVPATKWHFDYGNEHYSEGLATVEIYHVDPNKTNVRSSRDRNTYKGVVNTDGQIVLSNKNWEEITPFKSNRAFVKDLNKNWYMIDRKGQILNNQPYKAILYEIRHGNPDYLFQGGIQFVESDRGWGAIDTTGQYVIAPKDIHFSYRNLYRRGQIVFTEEDISIENDEYSYHYGFWNTKTGVVVEPQFHYINFSEFADDLTYVMQDDRIGYINHQGNYVWRESKNKEQKHGRFNVDYMNRGYFYASSPKKEELAGYGGWGRSGNNFQKIKKSKTFESEKLNLKVIPDDKDTYRTLYEGMKLYVANSLQDTLFFDAQDSRLYLKIQAQDEDGQWKDIEYLPSSWCGNSYHTLFLPPSHYWEFVIPSYEGELKTKLRARLLYKENPEQKEDSVIYSNEFEGSVNPGQFWRKNPYYPGGIMDPYND